MPRELNLPAWAKPHPNRPHAVQVDLDGALPAYFAELGVAEDQIDQYWITVAMICIRLDIQAAVAGTELAPPAGGAFFLMIEDRPKWALKNFEPGYGEMAAKKGDPENPDVLKARDHYKRIRGLSI